MTEQSLLRASFEQDGFRVVGPSTAGWEYSLVRRYDTPDRGASIFVTTETIPPGESLPSYCAAKIASVDKAPEFRLLEKRDVDVGGLRGLRAHFTWLASGTRQHQMVVWLASPGRVLVSSLTFTEGASHAQEEEWISTFTRMVSETRLAWNADAPAAQPLTPRRMVPAAAPGMPASTTPMPAIPMPPMPGVRGR